MSILMVPTVAEYARMPWHARAGLMRQLQQRRAGRAGGRPGSPDETPEQVRERAQRILDGLQVDPGHVVAARRRLLHTEYGGVR